MMDTIAPNTDAAEAAIVAAMPGMSDKQREVVTMLVRNGWSALSIDRDGDTVRMIAYDMKTGRPRKSAAVTEYGWIVLRTADTDWKVSGVIQHDALAKIMV